MFKQCEYNKNLKGFIEQIHKNIKNNVDNSNNYNNNCLLNSVGLKLTIVNLCKTFQNQFVFL